MNQGGGIAPSLSPLPTSGDARRGDMRVSLPEHERDARSVHPPWCRSWPKTCVPDGL
jgi:hypothetical protein